MRPAVSTSMSTKFTPSLCPKYVSPKLRPPVIAIALSATNILLCMRRCRRAASLKELTIRQTAEARLLGSGLNSRISMFFSNPSLSTCAFLPAVLKSSNKIRTRTPLSAASLRASNIRSVVGSA